jgi:hypothetical protein
MAVSSFPSPMGDASAAYAALAARPLGGSPPPSSVAPGHTEGKAPISIHDVSLCAEAGRSTIMFTSGALQAVAAQSATHRRFIAT